MKTFICCLLLLSYTQAFAQPDIQKAKQLLVLGEWQKARKILQPIATKGHQKAQYLLATTYSGRNEKQAFNWYLKSAKQGNDKSQLIVGKMFSFGIGVDKDTDKAIYWYQESAKLGNKSAKQTLDYLLPFTKSKPKW